MPTMSYLVLARKYRPQTFAEVIGQEHVTRTLQNAIRRGRIHHAFLFCGGRGTGKTTTARILAKALSCEQAPTAEPCNRCPACIEITQGTSVDVQEIDAASQNRVEDIRDLRDTIRYAPVRGKKKLFILDEVHMLSTAAFNALLKTLEEPPEHAVFVFATTDPHKLPQTILSRVQRYDFKLVSTAKLVEHLADVLRRESIEFEPAALYIIAREGGGSVRDSLSLLDQVLASADGRVTEALAAAVLGVADRGLILSLGLAIADRNPVAALAIVDDAYQRGFDLAQLSRTMLPTCAIWWWCRWSRTRSRCSMFQAPSWSNWKSRRSWSAAGPSCCSTAWCGLPRRLHAPRWLAMSWRLAWSSSAPSSRFSRWVNWSSGWSSSKTVWSGAPVAGAAVGRRVAMAIGAAMFLRRDHAARCPAVAWHPHQSRSLR
jgi:DNA polymerase III subunit gamma/tau